MKEMIKKLDVKLGCYIDLQYSHFVKYDKVLGTEGQYSKEDWVTHRKSINIYEDSADGDQVFLEKVLFSEFNKTVAFNELTSKFDFSKYKNILEIGAGYMYQTFLLRQYCGDVDITASDFDSEVISQSSNVKLLDNIEKIEFDILKDSIDTKYDLAISWAVEYHFTTDELLLVLNKLADNNTNFLVLSLTVGTPIRNIKNILKRKANSKEIKNKSLRAHGWERSLKYFNGMANKANFKFNYLGKCGRYHALFFYK